MDGFTVATEIINKYGRTKRPVISALTANSDTKTRQRCFEVGMDYVLMKPINLEHLRSELSKLVDFHEELNFQHEFDTPPQLVSKSTDEAGSSKETTQYDIAPQQRSETVDQAGSSSNELSEDSPAPQLQLPARRELHNNNHKEGDS
jgi:DNA-binding response OmpR family regulator